MSSAPPLMLEKAVAALKNAYAPYSHFPVAACIQSEDDQLLVGCNVENAAYGLTQCAEANAIGTMIANGKKQIKEILILTPQSKLCPPCGSCRQQIWEFATEDTVFHLCTLDGQHKVLSMEALLPFAFGSKNLETI